MRLVFAGTPEVAVPALRALLGSRHDVVAVITRPDARAGRGRSLHPSPVRLCAQEAGVPVLTPASAREESLRERLVELAPDACPVVAYGGLIPPDLLRLPRLGWVNLHFSLLPAWRGAAPVQRAIIAGDQVSGATTFVLERGLDTGPVLGALTEQVRPRDTAGDLLARLSRRGADLLLATLDGLEQGQVVPRPQPAEGVSHAPRLDVDDARIDWTRPGYAVDRLVRGTTPAPGAWTTFRGERLGILPVRPDADDHGLAPGQLEVARQSVHVGCGSGAVLLGEVHPHGRRVMPAADWARGVRPAQGDDADRRAAEPERLGG
ncbi:MAG: methionyl-tRNA formyltransferase [Actinomycetota bacterium]|nr:methionyl-tRNA formyltransferase [Actinomycetota bacterium]